MVGLLGDLTSVNPDEICWEAKFEGALEARVKKFRVDGGPDAVVAADARIASDEDVGGLSTNRWADLDEIRCVTSSEDA